MRCGDGTKKKQRKLKKRRLGHKAKSVRDRNTGKYVEVRKNARKDVALAQDKMTH